MLYHLLSRSPITDRVWRSTEPPISSAKYWWTDCCLKRHLKNLTFSATDSHNSFKSNLSCQITSERKAQGICIWNFRGSQTLTNIVFDKITKIVRALWLAERRACMRVRKTWLCDVKIHATSPITRFSNVSFDWSVEKCHCQINVVRRYVLMS